MGACLGYGDMARDKGCILRKKGYSPDKGGGGGYDPG